MKRFYSRHSSLLAFALLAGLALSCDSRRGEWSDSDAVLSAPSGTAQSSPRAESGLDSEKGFGKKSTGADLESEESEESGDLGDADSGSHSGARSGSESGSESASNPALAKAVGADLREDLKSDPTSLADLAPLAEADKGERLVTLGGSATELAFALGLGPQVVGVDASSLWPQEAGQLPKVGYYRQFSVEGILSLAPTVVLASAEAGPQKSLDQLEHAGVKVHRLPPATSVAQARQRILEGSVALGRAERGRQLLASLDKGLGSLTSPKEPRPKVLFFMNHGGRALMVAGEQTQAQAMIELAGAENAVQDFKGYRELSPESALLAAPDWVLCTSSALELGGGIEGLKRHLVLGKLEAVKEGRVIDMDDLFLLGFGPRLAEAVGELATRLHGPSEP